MLSFGGYCLPTAGGSPGTSGSPIGQAISAANSGTASCIGRCWGVTTSSIRRWMPRSVASRLVKRVEAVRVADRVARTRSTRCSARGLVLAVAATRRMASTFGSASFARRSLISSRSASVPRTRLCMFGWSVLAWWKIGRGAGRAGATTHCVRMTSSAPRGWSAASIEAERFAES